MARARVENRGKQRRFKSCPIPLAARSWSARGGTLGYFFLRFFAGGVPEVVMNLD
jgi:hypothetical protein